MTTAPPVKSTYHTRLKWTYVAPIYKLQTYLDLSIVVIIAYVSHAESTIRKGHQLRAIDLYSGVGGWGLGLKLAGIEVVASYEWWPVASRTHNLNLGGNDSPVDIRKLELSSLPRNIDLVVGSPPCTQFSYSNRGGNGDIADGMKDLVKFLEIVEYLEPKFWALENVPRVAGVLQQGFTNPGHPLYRFRNLGCEIHTLDMSDYGVPQARKRCIAGKIPFGLLAQYGSHSPKRTLGEVIDALSKDRVIDPLWGTELTRSQLTEMETEQSLSGEELRMNREAKVYHPVYNNMAFPETLDSPARTVTATCTRVSRESLVISDPKKPEEYRRLTIRERASLQGFPITYQFYGSSFGEKAKMVGNAIPPAFTYLLAKAVQGASVQDVLPISNVGRQLTTPTTPATKTKPDAAGRTYNEKRRFRSALPNLRFKSGMRFDLSNDFSIGLPKYEVKFYYGSSVDIREIILDGELWDTLNDSNLVSSVLKETQNLFKISRARLMTASDQSLQASWTRRQQGIGPFEVVDILGDIAREVQKTISRRNPNPETIAAFVLFVAGEGQPEADIPGSAKMARYAVEILSGFIVGSWFNNLQRA